MVVLHLNWGFHCFVMYTGKKDSNSSDIPLKSNLKTSQDQDEEIHSLTSTVCQSFYQWYRDDENEESVVFVKALDKVNEKPPNKPAEGNLSIYPSIYPSIHSSIHPSIH